MFWLHTHRDSFVDWLKYSTDDAVHTMQLYEFFRSELESRSWSSGGEQQPESESVSEHAEDDLDLGATARTSTTSTENNMWTFYSRYYETFGEVLNQMECRGTRLSVEELERIEKD